VTIEIIIAMLIIFFGIACICLGFYMTKYRFFKKETFEIFRDITPLPSVVNYWLLKLLFILGGVFLTVFTVMGGYLQFANL
jgi:hypothetical protein